jgi:hypothetical protein
MVPQLVVLVIGETRHSRVALACVARPMAGGPAVSLHDQVIGAWNGVGILHCMLKRACLGDCLVRLTRMQPSGRHIASVEQSAALAQGDSQSVDVHWPQLVMCLSCIHARCTLMVIHSQETAVWCT